MHGSNSKLRVLLLSGSQRKQSLNQKLVELAAASAAIANATTDIGHLSDFDSPFYDGDDERNDGVPDGARRFGERLKSADALIISSPEYNASIPGQLKNLIDWASRIRPQPFNGKHALLMSASPSMVGGNRGLWSLRIPLEHLGTRVYPDMFSLAQAHESFGSDGRLLNAVLQKRFDDTLGCFLGLVEAAKHYPGLKKQWVEFLGERPNHATDRVEESEILATA